MDDTRSVLIRYVGINKDPESFVFVLIIDVNNTVKQHKNLITSSVKYSNSGTYRQPPISDPLNWPTFLYFAFLGSL